MAKVKILDHWAQDLPGGIRMEYVRFEMDNPKNPSERIVQEGALMPGCGPDDQHREKCGYYKDGYPMLSLMSCLCWTDKRDAAILKPKEELPAFRITIQRVQFKLKGERWKYW